jgi:hypothetical protein
MPYEQKTSAEVGSGSQISVWIFLAVFVFVFYGMGAAFVESFVNYPTWRLIGTAEFQVSSGISSFSDRIFGCSDGSDSHFDGTALVEKATAYTYVGSLVGIDHAGDRSRFQHCRSDTHPDAAKRRWALARIDRSIDRH